MLRRSHERQRAHLNVEPGLAGNDSDAADEGSHELLSVLKAQPTHLGEERPSEILTEYSETRFSERLYNIKVGIVWADIQYRVDAASVLACCGDQPLVAAANTRVMVPSSKRCDAGLLTPDYACVDA